MLLVNCRINGEQQELNRILICWLPGITIRILTLLLFTFTRVFLLHLGARVFRTVAEFGDPRALAGGEFGGHWPETGLQLHRQRVVPLS